MVTTRTYVIVGASLAGAQAAQALREEGFDGRVVLVGEEAERPYARPSLSKSYLQGESTRDGLFVHDESFYADHDIELRTATTAIGLDPAEHTVTLSAGARAEEVVHYDRLLLATGSSPRRLDVPGSDLAGVLSLRTLGDADRLSRAIAGATTVAVVGAGWIGAEVAASARVLGREVVMIDPLSAPLERVLGPEVGAVYRSLHERHGVSLRFGTSVARFHGRDTLEAIELPDGSRVPADVALVGIGATPNVALAADAGLAVDDGIVVDAQLRTSAPDVYAAGDVASAFHPLFGTPVRVEHWANALNQGPAAARSMLGSQEPYERIPYFYSDQYEFGMEYSGFARSWDRVVFRGDPSSGAFLAFWIADGRVAAGMSVNVWDQVDAIQELVRSRATVVPASLADVDAPLDALVAGPVARP